MSKQLLVDYTVFEVSPQSINESLTQNNGKLIVKVDRSVAFAFEHEREKIIKKINLFFGYVVINKVEIIQASNKVKKTSSYSRVYRRLHGSL